MAHTAILRKVGGSVMVAIPPALLDVMGMASGEQVSVSVDGGKLVIAPQAKPKYTLDELLAQCDPGAPLSEEDRAWTSSAAVGREEI
jgi:antitoxin ChpS